MDYITSTKHKQNGVLINTKHPMFKNEYLIVDFSDGWLEISTPTIDYNGKLYKTTATTKYGWRSIVLSNTDITPGRYYIDESESDEDLAVFDVTHTRNRSQI